MINISDELANKLPEWYKLAESHESRDLVFHHKTTNGFADVGFSLYKGTSKQPPMSFMKIGNIYYFDSIQLTEFSELVAMVSDSHPEPLKRNTTRLGSSVFHEKITSKLGGRGLRIGGVNNNDVLITLTFHLVPTDQEYFDEFMSREVVPGGVEDQIIKYWEERYGILTREDVERKISELLKNNQKTVDIMEMKARFHDALSRRYS